jgi:class 3 adenylate cyclase
MFFEVMILAFLLFKRFEWERTEMEKSRLLAQNEVVEKTKENEKIVREQNVILERKVKDRTEQLQQINDELKLSLEMVECERQKSDKLLLNILPQSTAQELKEKGCAEPNIYESVTVLFADFKNFTQTTQKLSPKRLVNNLNHCFSAFDKIIQKYNVEKIKTIGDAYMAAGGLFDHHHTHSVETIKAAFEMLEFVENWKLEQLQLRQIAWDIRIGLHTGSVIAGVVGIHKFSFDIWGDTVNTASRMELHGTPGRVNISASTYALVKDQFRCQSRGKIYVKGKGELEMFWVEKMSSALA